MTYASLTDLTDRAGEAEIAQISDRDRSGSPDPEVVAAALRDADAMIDGYIAARYAVPLASRPALVRSWAVSIARYLLHPNGAPEHVARDYKDAVSSLKDVARGAIALPVAPGETAPAAQVGTIMAEHPPQIFTPHLMRGWRC